VGAPDACQTCAWRAAWMDCWGVAGCRRHRDTIIGWLRQGLTGVSWPRLVAMAAQALGAGLALKLDPLDPCPGLVDEAILRAERRP